MALDVDGPARPDGAGVEADAEDRVMVRRVAVGRNHRVEEIVREPMSMYGVPVIPMFFGPTDPPGGFLVANGPMIDGPTSQTTAPVVAS